MVAVSAVPWIILQNIVNTITAIKRSPYFSAENQPDAKKKYPGKAYLFASRIFKPQGASSKLPLVIRMHGGGFIMNSPATDDTLARYLADRAHCVVVSVDYRKAPLHPFPAAYEDLIDLTLATIEDPQLDIDPQRVVLCGTSAGGNLALAIAQDSRLRGKLLGVLAITPLVDAKTTFEEKMVTRPDANVPDFLESMYPKISDLYLADSGVSLDDTRISPIFFEKRADLPQHMYLTSAEHDLLWQESELMAEKLAQGSRKQETSKGWLAGTVRWDLNKGQKHAFEAFPEKDKALEAARVAAVASAYADMVEWLQSIFASAAASPL